MGLLDLLIKVRDKIIGYDHIDLPLTAREKELIDLKVELLRRKSWK